MIIEFEGKSWQYDEDAVTVQQAMALHLAHGLTIKAWQQAIPELDPRAVQFCYWLMKQQNGEKKTPLKDCEFPAVEFMSAYMAGLKADVAEEDEEEPEPDPTPPSPPDAPPSPGPSTPTATTRRRRPPVPEAATGS